MFRCCCCCVRVGSLCLIVFVLEFGLFVCVLIVLSLCYQKGRFVVVVLFVCVRVVWCCCLYDVVCLI